MEEPAVLYARNHGGPHFEFFDRTWAGHVSVTEDEQGFVSGIDMYEAMVFDSRDDERGHAYRVIVAPRYDAWEDAGVDVHRYLIAVTPEYIFYRDFYSHLAVPTHFVAAWVLEVMDYPELFNHLALFNRYFTSIVMPVFLQTTVVFLISQILMIAAAIWLFGHWQKLSGNMSVKERLAVCTFASVPANLVAFVIGIFLPVFHVFAAQLIMIYVSYKAMKEYWNA